MDSETKFTSKRENEWSSSDSRAESEYDISSPKSKVNVHFLDSNENLRDDSTSDVNDSIKKKNMTFYNCDYDIKCDAVNYNVYTSNESQNFSVGTYAVANDKLISQTSKNTDNSVSLYDIQNSEFSNDYNQISNDSINNDNTGHPNKQIDSDMYEDINQIEDWNEKILTNCENLISNSLKNIEESKPMNDDTQKSSVYGDFLNKGAQNIIHNSEQLRLLTEQQNIHSINQFNNSQIVIENQEKLNEYKNFEVKSHYVRREKFPGNDNFAHNSFDAQYNKLIPFNPVNVNTTEKDTELNAPENKTKKEIIRRQLNNQRERLRVRDINEAYNTLGKIICPFRGNCQNMTKLMILQSSATVIVNLQNKNRQLSVRVRDMNESFQTLKEMIEKSEDIVNKPNTKLNIIDSTIHLIKTLEKNVKGTSCVQVVCFLEQKLDTTAKLLVAKSQQSEQNNDQRGICHSIPRDGELDNTAEPMHNGGIDKLVIGTTPEHSNVREDFQESNGDDRTDVKLSDNAIIILQRNLQTYKPTSDVWQQKSRICSDRSVLQSNSIPKKIKLSVTSAPNTYISSSNVGCSKYESESKWRTMK
ncbi:hypothetical protein A3Q56_00888 [Intoshia linei]|uniref:BHLH domain-containing protein n=1 Tax=Intoshia linei TaxID=1819745 RepID=A0A177BCR6_9BILA|nr:hypothetical protein A3Q56_00888 [Intoshia linei]